MALPNIDTPQDKGQIQEAVKDIAQAVFKSARVSMEAAAKVVVPSIPEMVDEVLDDLKSGSVRTFNLALDKLDKLIQKLGIDLKDYSKELANFQARREEKLIKSEEKIQSLREKNIVAMIEKSGDIKVLSKAEIEVKQRNLRDIERNIEKEEKLLKKEIKTLQESDKLKTNAVKKAREDIEDRSKYIDQLKQKRQEEVEVLGDKAEEQPSFFQRAREGAGNFVDEYVPTPIAEVGQAFVEGLMAPITIMKDLATTFGGLLKPLKLLKPLFTGLVAGLKRFVLGLATSVIAFLPFLAIAAAVVLAIMGVVTAIKKFKEALGFGDEEEDKQKGEGKYQSLDEGTYDAIETQDAPTVNRDSKDPKAPFFDPKSKTIIQPDNPNYFDIKSKAYPDDPVIQKAIPEEFKSKTKTDLTIDSQGDSKGGTFTSVNSPQTVVNRTSNSLSNGISGVSNKDNWYNTATA